MRTIFRPVLFSFILMLSLHSSVFAQAKPVTVAIGINITNTETTLYVNMKPQTVATNFKVMLQEQGSAVVQEQSIAAALNATATLTFTSLKPKTSYTLSIIGTPTDPVFEVFRRTYPFSTTYNNTGNPKVLSQGGTSTNANTAPTQQQSGLANTSPTPQTQQTDLPLSIQLKNPLKVDTVQDAIKVFMDAVIKIAIPFIVVFFIWAGLQFILAQGNETKLTKAKKTFWYTVIGTLLILGAWAITDAIIGTVNSIAS